MRAMTFDEVVNFLEEKENTLRQQKYLFYAEKYSKIKTKIYRQEPLTQKDYDTLVQITGMKEEEWISIIDNYKNPKVENSDADSIKFICIAP